MDRVADRVKETTTTSGTGNVTLAGAASGYRSFNTAFGVGPSFYYCIVDGTAWEVGAGTLSGATTLVRNTIFKSTNSNTAISLSGGSADVFCTAPEEMFADMNGKIIAFSRAAAMP